MDDAAKTAAEDAAKSVKGVKSVVNNVMLTPPPPPPAPPVSINPDDVLKSSVDSSINAAGITGVTATIANGEVTLTGTIKKADLRKVMQAANEAKPKKGEQQTHPAIVTAFQSTINLKKARSWHYKINTQKLVQAANTGGVGAGLQVAEQNGVLYVNRHSAIFSGKRPALGHLRKTGPGNARWGPRAEHIPGRRRRTGI